MKETQNATPAALLKKAFHINLLPAKNIFS